MVSEGAKRLLKKGDIVITLVFDSKKGWHLWIYPQGADLDTAERLIATAALQLKSMRLTEKKIKEDQKIKEYVA